LEQQTATAEVLQVINSSPGNLAPVFDAILEKAHSLCGAAHGALGVRDGDNFRAVATHGLPEQLSAMLCQPFPAYPGGPHERLLQGERLIHIADQATSEQTHPIERASVEIGGARTLLFIPLRKDGTLLGYITAARQQVRPFSDKQIALLENFAAQAVIAMENARLITETREALEQQTATAEVLQVINSSPGNLAPVFAAILEKAHTLCGAAHGALATYDGKYFRAAALRAMPEPFGELLRQPFRLSAAGSAQRRLLQGERSVHIPDVRAVDPVTAIQRASIDAGVRTLLMVPLRRDDALLGYITAHRREVRPFTEKEIALLENFAAQAVIAMENARLITETREALQQQTATAEVLGVINSSPGDLAPVFDAMLEKATRLCQAQMGAFWTYDGENMHVEAIRGASPQFAEFLKQGPHHPSPGQQQLLHGERIVHVVNIAEGPSYRSGDPLTRAAADLGGIGTILVVPLRKDGILLGTIGIYRQEVRPFSDKQIALLQNFAAQAVIAMENARLLTETREALEQQTATAEVLQVINSSPGDLAPVFDAILEKAHSLCNVAYGGLALYDREYFRAVAIRGYPTQLAQTIRRPFRGNASHQELVRGTRYVHTPDMQALAPELIGTVGQATTDAGFRTNLMVPLRKDNTLLGHISASRSEVRPFSEKEIALLENFAAQAVVAMENARLLTETREALEQQTAVAEVLGVINSSPGDLAPVFDAILEKAHTLCGAAIGALLTFDGESFGFLARKVPPELAEITNRPFKPGPQNRLNDLIRGEPLLHILDAMEVLALAPEDPQLHATIELGGMRTFLAVPLRKEDRLLGAITAARQEVRPFSDKQIALLQNFAAQAVIAMENARLLRELRQRTDEVGELNRGLEARVAEQVEELGRVGRLKRFLAPQLAELIVSQGDERILESHRRDIVVVFCDLRGYTAFTETAEPEEVLDFLREYHGALGPLVGQFEGTLDQFSGDGIMVFFNDPVPCPNPAERGVKMAMAMREAAGALIADWRERGRELGFGAGIAQGYATLGQIGFSERSGYTAIGTVCNVAARLCAEAKDGQILLSQRVNVALKGSVATEQLGPLTLKGLTQPVLAYNVPPAAIQPALRIIEGGPQSV
jgi:GAF domain-containing protein